MSTWGFQSEEQRRRYDDYRGMGYEYSMTDPYNGIIMERFERGYDYTRCLDRICIESEGAINQLSIK